MTYSMTAFANGEIDFENLTIHCEIRSVNHRYCDISLKLADRFHFIETDARHIISKHLKRGKIDCILSYKEHQQDQQTLNIDINAVKSLLKTTHAIEQYMSSSKSFSALDILNFPGIQVEQESDKAALQQALQQVIQTTLNHLLNARQREGEQLKKLINTRCKDMQQYVIQAKTRLPIVIAQLRAKLKKKIAQLISDPEYDRIEQEMVLLIHKLDVDEELDRLETHISEILRVLEKNEPVGRRLDFLIQELHREANTLGSKSADQEMTAISIELKVLIEQIREQVQNIE